MGKQKFYSLKKILECNAQYNVIFGERSNGKSYAVLKYGIEQYEETGKQIAIVRRWHDDFVGKRGASMFSALESNGEIYNITNGKWNGVYYYSSRWYMCRYEDGKRVETDEKPCAYGFSLSGMEHDKSTSFPEVTTILFDEFLSRSQYITDEFVLFMNVVSTIIRGRKDVKIFMLGNTVNKYCPYFSEMGLEHIKNQKPGTIDIYRYGDSELTVAVEYIAPTKNGKENDLYFAFDNPRLKMITGGAWEIDIYPHCPVKYRPVDILFTYFIQFDGDLLQCEIVDVDGYIFTFVHRKTGEIKNPDTDLLFTTEYSHKPNVFRKITKTGNPIAERLLSFYRTDRVFYASNDIGEIVRNYIVWCNRAN